MKLFFPLVASSALANQYIGDKVFRVRNVDKQKEVLLERISFGEDIWKKPHFSGDDFDVHIPKERLNMFEGAMSASNLEYEEMISDLGAMIEEQKGGIAPAYDGYDNFNYEKYHTFDDYQAWQADFIKENSDIAEFVSYGESIEGRDLNLVKIGKGSKTIVFHSGTHAREWINPITSVNILKRLVQVYREGGDEAKFLNDITWHVAIVTNPDGYVYSHTDDRMWRKTRNKDTPSQCVGVDPNRNYDANWSGPGASNNPCSQTYYGLSAFSEPCTYHARDYLLSLDPTPQANIDSHSYSQLWLFPYGYKTALCESHDKLYQMSKEIVDAIYSVHRTTFKYGDISSTIYVASGGTIDWTYDMDGYDNDGIPCSFCPELRDTGRYGFLLPEEQIKPVEEEMWEGYKVLAQQVIDGRCDSK